jgi:predicted PhzF superfamily epimerase YddE/YHI9
MKIPFHHIDAFTGRLFAGNPAGVCFLEEWLDDALLQSIAAENNLSETAFLVKPEPKGGEGYDLRWFTPTVEVDLCGHGTLAAAHAVFRHLDRDAARVDFATRSGRLSVTKGGDLLLLDLPALPAVPCRVPKGVAEALGAAPREALAARDLLLVFDDEAQVLALRPDMARLSAFDFPCVIATAPGTKSDFVSRVFAPRVGIPEDPATGSAHCTLAPYWSARTGKRELHALQLSRRGGELFCVHRGGRVSLGGRAVEYLTGTITL